jgi:hypothetical protein
MSTKSSHAPAAGVSVNPSTPSQAAPNTAWNTHYYSGAWAGYEIPAGVGTWSGVSAGWHVETATPPTDRHAAAEDTWIGIGGGTGDTSSNAVLIQAGTELMSGENDRDWVEIAATPDIFCYKTCSGVSFVSPNVPKAGDNIWALVYWASSTKACFVLTDTSRAAGGLNGCVNMKGYNYDRRTAEWIDEGHVPVGWELMDFHRTNWINPDIFNPANGTYTPFVNYKYASVVMAEAGTSPVAPCASRGLLAYAENPARTGFDTVWCRFK